MNIIIDTHIFLWALSDPSKISVMKRAELETAGNTVFVSAISIAEIMIKASIGKLQIDFDPVDMVKQSGFDLLDVSGEDAFHTDHSCFLATCKSRERQSASPGNRLPHFGLFLRRNCGTWRNHAPCFAPKQPRSEIADYLPRLLKLALWRK